MGLRDFMNKTKAEPLPEFELQRKRLGQQLNQEAQAKRDAMQRQFAQLQGGPSGAQIKLGQQLETDIGQRREAAESDLFGQEIAYRRQLDEAEKQRQFAASEAEKQRVFGRGEREASQLFATGESQRQREFATAERLGSQQFATGESQKQREFQQKLTDQDYAFKDKLFQFDKQSKLRQMDLAEQEFAADQRTTEFNKFISVFGLPTSSDQVSGLRTMIEDPGTSKAGVSAALQYLNGLGENYITKENLDRLHAGKITYQQAVATSKPYISNRLK